MGPELLMGGASIAGGIFGNIAANEDRKAASRLIEQQLLELEQLGIPPIEAQQIVMEKYRSAGELSPELEDAVSLSNSKMEGIELDPRSKQAKLAALDALTGISDSGGMNLSDRAALEKTMANINADERGAREAILAKFRARGGAGSGSELVAQLMNQQDAANRANSAGLNVAAQAQQRALDAIMQRGRLGGEMESQEFDQKAKIAAAQDAIARWNAENTQGVRGQNVNRMNSAKEYNLKNAQNILNSNVDLGNKEQSYNKGLYQQYFNNQMDLSKARGNARSNSANNFTQNANNTAQMWQGIGSGVSQTIGGIDNANQREYQKQQDRSRIEREDRRWEDLMNLQKRG